MYIQKAKNTLVKRMLLFLLVVIANLLFSQKSTIKVKKEPAEQTFILRDRSAYYKDSTELDGYFIVDYINSNLILPDSVKNGLISGTIYVSFTIKETGDLDNIKISGGVPNCYSCRKEAIRLISNMPKWYPEIIKNIPVASKRTLPISFKNKK